MNVLNAIFREPHFHGFPIELRVMIGAGQTTDIGDQLDVKRLKYTDKFFSRMGGMSYGPDCLQHFSLFIAIENALYLSMHESSRA
jgi:hypothetical protein